MKGYTRMYGGKGLEKKKEKGKKTSCWRGHSVTFNYVRGRQWRGCKSPAVRINTLNLRAREA